MSPSTTAEKLTEIVVPLVRREAILRASGKRISGGLERMPKEARQRTERCER